MRIVPFLLLLIGCTRSAHPPTPLPHAPVCESADAAVAPTAHGEVTAIAADGTPHPLYWARLAATTQPARGTLFYLAGGPQSHLEYSNLAAAFQKLAYPQFDVVLYDYFGFNCSTSLQSVATLARHAPALTVPAMATDFIQLKRKLVGDAKAYVMGGSHGAMLGAQIVADYPDEIAKAILFSGDTQSGWLEDGWFRFDAVLADLAAHDPGFAANLDQLLARASRGELAVEIDGKHVVVDRPGLEIGLWLAASLDSTVQAGLPELVKLTLDGDLEALAAIYGAELALLAAIPSTSPPTEASVVTNFHRCNVWFPPSARDPSRFAGRTTRYLAYDSFVRYWTRLCKDYDRFGEYPLHVATPRPTAVPILAWTGDRDNFEPDATRARFAQLTSNLVFEVMPGWSHDFGPDAAAGVRALASKIERFLR
jgi:pimeloyl-ACP methyl ester carboxylesterase